MDDADVYTCKGCAAIVNRNGRERHIEFHKNLAAVETYAKKIADRLQSLIEANRFWDGS